MGEKSSARQAAIEALFMRIGERQLGTPTEV
jgi:hypothetical protein